jgi:hypothetical protein
MAASGPPLVGRRRGCIIGGGGQIDLPVAWPGKTSDAAATFGTTRGRARLNGSRWLTLRAVRSVERDGRGGRRLCIPIRACTLHGNRRRAARRRAAPFSQPARLHHMPAHPRRGTGKERWSLPQTEGRQRCCAAGEGSSQQPRHHAMGESGLQSWQEDGHGAAGGQAAVRRAASRRATGVTTFGQVGARSSRCFGAPVASGLARLGLAAFLR